MKNLTEKIKNAHIWDFNPVKKYRLFMSLNLKLSIVVVVGLLITAFVYFSLIKFEDFVAREKYTSKNAVEKNVGEAYKSLEEYIKSDGIKGVDSDALQNWVNENNYVYLYIYDNQKSTFDGGWKSESAGKKVTTYGLTPEDERKNIENKTRRKPDTDETQGTKLERITPDGFKTDIQNRLIKFSDDYYYVYINVYKEEHWREIMMVIKILIAVATFLFVILVYNGKVLRRIISLSVTVGKISEGDLKASINPKANDEIGKLARGVDDMRYSILKRLISEKEAWDANTQLITAMSHDIRTPMTSLIGYLDIIEGGNFNSYDDIKQYISSCRDKAFQLKELSDKLFQYFLVFGSHDKEINMEIFDAGILIQQLISEHTAELINYGYKIDFEYNVPNVDMRAELSGMKRLFDNVFSNVMKYGDKRFHVSISAVKEEDAIVIRILNSILSSSKKVESNKIGLKTCERICLDIGGNFSYQDDGNLFINRIKLPIHKGSDDLVEEEKDAEQNKSI